MFNVLIVDDDPMVAELNRLFISQVADFHCCGVAATIADANAMLADSDAYFEHLAKQDLVFQAIAEQLDITPTQEQIDSANSSYADTYGAQRSMLNALQLAVLDKVEESAVLS